jgi:DNA-binding NarL/FixJ family response regulator
MKILLADPNPEVRSALQFVIEHTPGMCVAGETGRILQLLRLCTQQCSDLVLLDPELIRRDSTPRHPGSHPLADVLAVIHRLCPGTKVVVMSSQFEMEQEALTSGADGFISKTDPPEIFKEKITNFYFEFKKGV